MNRIKAAGLAFSIALTGACAAHDDGMTSESNLGESQALLSGAVAPRAAFGSNPGGLKLYEYVPKPLTVGAPLVLVLHGCTQSAADATHWGWNELADQAGFVVGYPEQQTANNSVRCFNWGGEYGDLANLQRGKGENESLKQMVSALVAAHGLDAKRVYVVGFSAGAAMALVAAAAWPDVFAGAASLSGIPYACNATYSEVFTCQNPGVDRTPKDWGDRVRKAFPSFSGSFPKVSVWQGATDTTVGTKNRREIVKQWTNVHGASDTATSTDTVDGAKRERFADGTGKIVVESYEVPGMTHGVSVAPSQGCGKVAAYSFDKGICTSRRVAEFFGLVAAAPPALLPDGGIAPPSPATLPDGGVAPSGAQGGAPAAGGASGKGAGATTNDTPSDPRTAASTCGVSSTRAPGSFALAVVGLFGLGLVSRRTRRSRGAA
ncbi:MAG: PHB depolymerase family esterase [Myxococcales bacterium]|nr:PHB depolymerase family esterase [Myxococcales bacterium]